MSAQHPFAEIEQGRGPTCCPYRAVLTGSKRQLSCVGGVYRSSNESIVAEAVNTRARCRPNVAFAILKYIPDVVGAESLVNRECLRRTVSLLRWCQGLFAALRLPRHKAIGISNTVEAISHCEPEGALAVKQNSRRRGMWSSIGARIPARSPGP